MSEFAWKNRQMTLFFAQRNPDIPIWDDKQSGVGANK
jgi:hypothetical protein